MKFNHRRKPEKGMALVITMMLTLLLSALVGAMLISSTDESLINGNDLRNNQAFYIAEAGINRATGWFKAKFGNDPNSGLFVLPEYTPNAQPGALIYNAPLSYQKGASSTDAEQSIPTCVKVLINTDRKNVVLAGDNTNTYPGSYTVTANDSSGAPKNFSFTQVVSDFTASLHNQPTGEGEFAVKATLISIVPPSIEQPQGTITWLLKSTGRIIAPGNKTIASTTLYAYISAPLTPIKKTESVASGTTTINAGPGFIARRLVAITGLIRVDSYKSSKGGYGTALSANSYPGQIGAMNVGSHGDIRTNNETLLLVSGGISMPAGTITGKGYGRLPAPALNLLGGLPVLDPVAINTLGLVSNGKGGTFSANDKNYNQPPMTFPAVPDPTPPAGGAPNYTHVGFGAATLPSGNYNNITVANVGTLALPPGNYGLVNVANAGKIILGVPGQRTVYNFQSVLLTGSAQIVFRGPVTINVANSLVLTGMMSVADASIPASAIRWNFKGGAVDVAALTLVGNMLGVFYAPNNEVVISGVGDIYGAIIGRDIAVTGTIGVHIDEDAFSGVQTTGSGSTDTIIAYTGSDYNLWGITQKLN
jgi:Tfp pilus assembly protein PilX